LAKSKKAPLKLAPVDVFKGAADEDADAEGTGEGTGGRADDDEGLVDWKALICNLCKRKFKDLPTPTKHVEASELHQSNLRAQKR